MFLQLKKKLAEAISSAAGVSLEEAEASVELPKGQFGDVATSICFSLAKREKKSPVALAAEICGKLKLPEWVSDAKTTGPYINFFLSDGFYEKIVETVEKEGAAFGKGTFRGNGSFAMQNCAHFCQQAKIGSRNSEAAVAVFNARATVWPCRPQVQRLQRQQQA